MASSIPGLSVSYLSDFDPQKPTKPGIPGLDVREGGQAMGSLRNPNVVAGGVGSDEARSFRSSLRQPVGIPGLEVTEGAPSATPRQPAAPSAGWLRRQASAVADAAGDVAGRARQGLSSAANDAAGVASKVAGRAQQGMAEGAAYLDGAFKPLASAPSEAKGLLRRGAAAVGEGTRRLAGAAGPLGALAEAGLGAKDVYDYAKTGASNMDVATKTAETAAGIGGASAGAAAGAAAGAGLGLATGPFAPIASPLLGLAGGAAGAYVGKEGTQAAIRGLRSMVGLDEDPTRAQAQAQPRAPEIMMAPPTAGLRPTTAPAAPSGPLTPTNAGADRDLTRELNAVPASLPTDMRPGIVAKTTGPGGRVTYSGTDVRENPSMVDGAGNNLTLRGSLTTLPGGPGSPGAASVALPAGGQGVAAPEPAGGMTGFGSTGAGNMLGRSPEQQRRDAQTQASSIVASTRAQGLRSMETLDKQGLADTAADASRFASQTSAEASKANARTAADASRYGADRQVDAAMASARGQGLRANLELQMKLQAQQAMAQAMRASGGDAGRAAQIMASQGFDPQTLTQLATNQQERSAKGKNDAESYFRASSVNPEGKIDDGLMAQHAEMANQITGGQWANMTNEQRTELAPDVVAGVKLLKGINGLRDYGIAKGLGIDNTTPAMTTLPDMTGASIDRVGKLKGAFTKDVSSGDYRIVTRDGQELFVPESAVDGSTLNMLERRGAKLNLKD